MISSANVLTDLYLSIAALIGVFCLIQSLQTKDPYDPVNRRFLFGLKVTFMLFCGRALVVITGGEDFRFVILLAAGLLPLAVALLTEGLLRRHAPPFVKAVLGIGAAILAVLAFVSPALIDPTRLWAILAFQLFGLGASGWMVVTRDKTSLSASENLMVGRLGLSLILLIPMVAADFMMVYIRLPVQISALGVLVLCWLAIGLGRPQTGHGGPLVSLAVLIVAAVCAGSLVGIMTEAGRGGSVIAVIVVLAAMLVVAILNDARSLRIEEQSESLLRHMADGTQTNARAFLRELQSHPLVEGAIMVEAAQLSDLDVGTLDQIFLAAPVLAKSEPPAVGEKAQDHIGHLFERFAATHILQVSAAPRLLVALAMPAISASPHSALELQAVQRMAALIARTEVQND